MTGCVQFPLKRNFVKQSATISELEQQQVIDNLALFAAVPEGLPHFALPSSGTTQIGGTASGGMLFNYTRIAFAGWNFNLGGSASEQANWVLAPVTDPGRVRRMRCAFQIAVGHYPLPARIGCEDDCYKCLRVFKEMGLLREDVCNCDPRCLEGTDAVHCQANLKACKNGHPPSDDYFDTLACHFPTGWFCVGTKHQVPRDACIVGRHCDTFVWVPPGGLDAFTRFTLTILTLATTDPPAPNAQVERTLDPQGRVTSFKVTTKENVVVVDIPKSEQESKSTWGPFAAPPLSERVQSITGPVAEPRSYAPFNPLPGVIQLQAPSP